MGFEVTFDLNIPNTNEANIAFWDKLIDFIETNELQIGGSLSNFFVTGKPRCTTTEANRKTLGSWLNRQSEISAARVEPLVDAWYGPFE